MSTPSLGISALPNQGITGLNTGDSGIMGQAANMYQQPSEQTALDPNAYAGIFEQPDLSRSAFTDLTPWGNFDPNSFKGINWASNLTSAYKPKNMGGSDTLPLNYSQIHFLDPTTDAAIQALQKQAYDTWTGSINAKSPDQTVYSGGSWWAPQYSTIPGAPKDTSVIDNPIGNPYDPAGSMHMASKSLGFDPYGTDPFSLLSDKSMRDSLINAQVQSSGLTYDDLVKNLGYYSKAYKDIYDPVGANWQDYRTAPFQSDFLSGIRQYAGYGDNFFNNINKLAADSPISLGPGGKGVAEYYALMDPNKAAIGDQITEFGYQNSAPSYWGGPNLPVSDIRGNIPYQHQDWTDYLSGNKPWWAASDADVSAAKDAMSTHTNLLHADPKSGGSFSLLPATGFSAVSGGKAGYKWDETLGGLQPRQLNIAQNALQRLGKTAADAGFDPDSAAQSQLTKVAAKKSGKGGLMSFLGPIASVAGLIPGMQLPMALLNAGLGFANGNPLGGLMSLAGANFGSGSLMDHLAEGMDSALGIMPDLQGPSFLSSTAVNGLGSLIGSGGDLKKTGKNILGSGLGSLAAPQFKKLLGT